MNITKGTSDWARLILALLVFNFHFMLVFNGKTINQLFGGIYFFANRGDVAVSGLFFLSGYALWNNERNKTRTFCVLVVRQNFQVLFPLAITTSLALMMIFNGFGNYALKASELAYGWNLIVPYGRLGENTSFSEIMEQFWNIVTYQLDVFSLSGWFVTPLLSMWSALAVFLLYFREKASKDLVFFVVFLCLVFEMVSPVTKGLVLCILSGAVLAAQKKVVGDCFERKVKPFLGVFYVPVMVFLFVVAVALAWMVRGHNIALAHIYNYNLVPLVYLVKELPYFSTIPLILFCLFFIGSVNKHRENKVIGVIAGYSYHFIIVHYFVFGVLINLMHYYLTILALYQVYILSFAGSLFMAFIIGYATKIISGYFFRGDRGGWLSKSGKEGNQSKEVAA